ncbi:transcription factor GTE4-like [Trifolium pratense]|uniref:transcription factor GTE4-like n=1 Tax=Trifolium pratense TaxID=57577 RepID=UPI001E693EFB|nr:transcription factor GTE4-like [Trifolium pratense]
MEPPTKRRFIIKFSYERDDNEKKKPIVTSYWVDSTSTTNKVSTTIKSQEESVKDVVVDSTSAAAPPHHHKVSSTTTKPMEHYKRMQCWVIVKRMVEGKDGWALKESLDLKYLKGLEKNKSKVQKTIGLKDIEAKLKSYSTPDEFAKDMRFVFSQGLLYHPRHIVHRIAVKFSETWQLV